MANQDWQRKAAEWLRGRQGPDDIVIFCTNLAFVLVVINLFARTGWLGWVALVLIAYAVFRIQSKNLGARARENAAFLKALGPARPWVQNPKAAFAEAKGYKHVKCASCGQRVRVPRERTDLSHEFSHHFNHAQYIVPLENHAHLRWRSFAVCSIMRL